MNLPSENQMIFAFMYFVSAFVVGLFFFVRYARVSRSEALLGIFLGAVAGAIYVFNAVREVPRNFKSSAVTDMILPAFAGGLCLLFLVAFVCRLWGIWVGEKATPAEREPGKAGVRAWFCTSNIVMGLFIVVLAWYGHDISPLLGALM